MFRLKDMNGLDMEIEYHALEDAINTAKQLGEAFQVHFEIINTETNETICFVIKSQIAATLTDKNIQTILDFTPLLTDQKAKSHALKLIDWYTDLLRQSNQIKKTLNQKPEEELILQELDLTIQRIENAFKMFLNEQEHAAIVNLLIHKKCPFIPEIELFCCDKQVRRWRDKALLKFGRSAYEDGIKAPNGYQNQKPVQTS